MQEGLQKRCSNDTEGCKRDAGKVAERMQDVMQKSKHERYDAALFGNQLGNKYGAPQRAHYCLSI